MKIRWKGKKKTNAALNRYEEHLEKKVKKIVATTTEIAVSKMKADAPFDEGNLRGQIQPEYKEGGLSAVIRAGAWYSPFLEYGTGIYSEHPTIQSRKDPWVYWSDDLNRYVFTRGIKPQPFFNHNADEAKRRFKREMKRL